jgi:hypothetical protein
VVAGCQVHVAIVGCMLMLSSIGMHAYRMDICLRSERCVVCHLQMPLAICRGCNVRYLTVAMRMDVHDMQQHSDTLAIYISPSTPAGTLLRHGQIFSGGSSAGVLTWVASDRHASRGC